MTSQLVTVLLAAAPMLYVVSSVFLQHATDLGWVVVTSCYYEDVARLELVFLPRPAFFQFAVGRNDADEASDKRSDQRSGGTTGGEETSNRDRADAGKRHGHDAHAREHPHRHSHERAFLNGDHFVMLNIVLEYPLIWVVDGHT